MFKDAKEFRAYLDELAGAAPSLRDAGVLRLEMGSIKADLVQCAGDLTVQPVAKDGKEGDEYDPLNDPVSYGLSPGDSLPFDDDDDGEED